MQFAKKLEEVRGSGRVSAWVKVGDKGSSHRDRSRVAEGKVVQTKH